MSEPHEYYTWSTQEMIPEGRKVYALEKAIAASHGRMTAAEILDMAKGFEAWLKEQEPKGKPKIAAVKNDAG